MHLYITFIPTYTCIIFSAVPHEKNIKKSSSRSVCLNSVGTFPTKTTFSPYPLNPSQLHATLHPCLRRGQRKRDFPWWHRLRHIKLTDAEPDFLYTSDGLTNWRLLLGERCPGTRCQQTSVDGPRCESGDERAMVTSPPRSPGSPQTDLRDRTPSPPSGPNNTSGNGPMWTEDAGLDNPAFEESTEEDSESKWRDLDCQYSLDWDEIYW